MCLNPGDKLRDRYRIIAELGRGGFGVTYLARDLARLGNPQRAVKEIPLPKSENDRVLAKARKDFDREADALENLGRHSQIPYSQIPQLFDRFEENRCFYLVQEYIEGRPLNEELTDGLQWSQARVVAFLRDILKVLQVVHHHGIVHRDLKPANLIRRDRDRKIVLVDFGAVREISSLETTDSGTVTRTRAIFSEHYTPPEQISRPCICEPYNDIYPVGMTAIQALTGLHPTQLLTDKETGEIVWHFSTPDRSMVTVDDRLEAILNQMIRYHFNQRYPSVDDVLADLQDLDLSELVEGVPETEFDRIESPNVPDSTALPALDSASPTHTNSRWQNLKPHLKPKLYRGLLAVSIVAASISLYRLLSPKTYSFVSDDRLSAGEQILLSDFSSIPKQNGRDYIFECRSSRQNLPFILWFIDFQKWQNCFGQKLSYRKAFKSFRTAWNDTRDPEAFIYFNNTFLEVNDFEYYTISISVPIRENNEGEAIDSDLSTELLQGVAQAQFEVNLELFERNRTLNIPTLDPQFKNQIEKNEKLKGLRVIITDDGNQVDRARSVATSLSQIPDLLGNIGHSSSNITLETLDIYEKNQLVTISPGSTLALRSPAGIPDCPNEGPYAFFSRTAPSTSTQAKVFADRLIQDLGITRATIFYNDESQSSYCFSEEFKFEFGLKGGTIVEIDNNPNLHQDEFDAKKAIANVRNRGDMAIVLMPDAEVSDSVDNAIEMLVANGDRNWIVGGWSLYNPKTLKNAARLPSLEKITISVPWHPLTSSNREFPEAARQLWGGSVSGNTALAYDAARAIVRAIQLQDRPSRRGMQQILRSPNREEVLTEQPVCEDSSPWRRLIPSIPFLGSSDRFCASDRPEGERGADESNDRDENRGFSAQGATGEIQFDPYTGDRKDLEAEWVRLVPCKAESSGFAFVPIEMEAAQLNCGT
ncbi:MAG: bifunctional serine/threonine-protein kinase/ABC transporter substrate-binding protein [Cyanobacteriota bacterium]|nr:bifunctional serine/threonine-protein kinase/ABC transporter substrate-binding protein [Cyanobacteriota bacterium]